MFQFGTVFFKFIHSRRLLFPFTWNLQFLNEHGSVSNPFCTRCLLDVSMVQMKCVSTLRMNKSLRMLSLMKKFQSQGTSWSNKNCRNTGPFISQTSQRFLSPFITCSCIPLPPSSLHSLAGLGLLCSKVKNCSELLSSHCLSHFLAFPLVCIIFIISSKRYSWHIPDPWCQCSL